MAMGVSVVTYTIDDANAAELNEKVREHLVPAARSASGYRGFALFDLGEDKRMAVLLFDSLADVGAAQALLTPVGRDHTYALMSGPAIGAAGTVLVADGVFEAEAGTLS
ncbi:MAG: hypothetical protein KF883_12225 [Thermomicrobiales bacterium]|nr:hypothetical protein [Thermomicrobiales bacterium]